MKKLIFLFLILFTTLAFSQNYTKRYNELSKQWEFFDNNLQLVYYARYNDLSKRWEYFDKNGNMFAYEQYNTITKQTEYVEINNTPKTNNSNTPDRRHIVHEYGEPESLFDANLAYKALQAKQNRYDRMSPAEKQKLARQREYIRKRNFVTRSVNKHINRLNKKSDRISKINKKEAKRNSAKIKKGNNLDIEDFENGWYISYMNDKTQPNTILKRFVYISNGEITKYINGLDLLLNVKSTIKNNNNNYSVQLDLLGDRVDVNLVFLSNKKKKEPVAYHPSRLIFYTKSTNIIGQIELIVENKKKYYPLQNIKYYLQSDHVPCEDNQYVSSVIIPSGKYTYHAYSETTYWTNEINLNSHGCKKINLTNN